MMKTKLTLFVTLLVAAMFGAGCASVGKAVEGTLKVAGQGAAWYLGIPAKSKEANQWDQAIATGGGGFSHAVKFYGPPEGGVSSMPTETLPIREGDGEDGYYFWRFQKVRDKETDAISYKRAKGSWKIMEGQQLSGSLYYLGLTFKKPDRGFLGISFQEDDGKRMEIVDVLDDSAAAKVGLVPNDVILAVNGKIIHGPADYLKKLYTSKPGTTIKLLVERNNEKLTYNVTLKKFPLPVLTKWKWDRVRPEKRLFYDLE